MHKESIFFFVKINAKLWAEKLPNPMGFVVLHLSLDLRTKRVKDPISTTIILGPIITFLRSSKIPIPLKIFCRKQRAAGWALELDELAINQ